MSSATSEARNSTFINRRDGRLLVVLLLAGFFGPYFPGTPFRLDQVIGWLHIAILLSGLAVYSRIRFATSVEKFVTSYALLILLFVSVRLFMDVENYRAAFQITNQFSYCSAGAAIFYVHRARLMVARTFFIAALLVISIIINLFAFYQIITPDSYLIALALNWYGGVGDEIYQFGDFNTISAITLLGGGQAVSIFSGVQGLAVFDLFIAAIAYGALKDTEFRRGQRHFAFLSLVIALVGGVLTGSKTFIFGTMIFYAIIAFCGGFTARHIRGVLFLLILFVLLLSYSADQLRVTGDVWNLITEVNVSEAFSSRFGSAEREGYLSDVMAKTFEPLTLTFGLGSSAVDYKYSDFQLREIILVGGVPLFVFYYVFLACLVLLNWRSRTETCYGIPLFALGITLLIANVGMDPHLQARTIPLWMIVNFLVGMPRIGAAHSAALSRRTYVSGPHGTQHRLAS